MSFGGKRRSVKTRPVRKAGVMTASRWSAINPAHSVRREVRSDDSRFDESSAGCPSTSCSPAELAFVSPAFAILLNLKQAVQRKTTVRPAASRLVSHARGQAQRSNGASPRPYRLDSTSRCYSCGRQAKRAYQASLRLSWISRAVALPKVFAIRPKLPSPRLRFGRANAGTFGAFTISVRKVSPNLSESWNSF